MVGQRRGAPPPGPRRITRSQSRVDRISALPDELLLQVLTRLRCARTAARTSILARRWRGVWTGLPEVSFRGLAPDAIHAALARVTRTSLEAIDIHVSRGTGRRALDAATITFLLHHAVADRSPLKLTLTIPVDLPRYDANKWIELPRFDHATSIELDVQNIRFALSPATEFPKLETLSLSGCIMDLAVLVPRCPRLRVLSVTTSPHKVDTITVHSESLQVLAVSTCRSTSTIDIVAPALRKLTLALGSTGIDNSLSVVAPMVEEVTWQCLYYSMVAIGTMWRVGSLKVWAVEKMELTDDEEGSHQPRRAHVLSLGILSTPYPSQRDFAEDLKKIPVTNFSVLKLKISTRGHVLGPLLLNLLRICTAVQRLDMVLVATPEVQVTQSWWSCKELCPCQENNREWRTKTTISAINLTEVNIKGLKGNEEEIHFLKLLCRCAPMLQTMTLKLSKNVTDDWYNIFLDTVQEHPSVNSNVFSDNGTRFQPLPSRNGTQLK
ncbi:uncharacterized protein LOC8082116 isoform X1 [Sorghum bicolor]|nr:uncharacterized protein LOC8082116 isoform X1 [Sorghum bicolor]XP_021307307.1 uncharacterized protein LOC8082116 isoform X1 [Sorghum bicolor]XP_021307308.1 uncharacterized protein LOC8082116 isoform X1 [Sorghum bicolor]|eukprot:XP_021307306.1 uncharacterized protein LOC8082116 isoform X1 [Sorghum bicolor]